MTVHNSKEVTADVFNDPDWPLFSQATVNKGKPTLPKLGVISYISRADSMPQDMDMLFDACVAQVKPKVFGNPLLCSRYKAWLFVAHSSWQPKSRVVMYKGLRNSLPEIPCKGLRFKELAIEATPGVRFAGIAEIDSATFRNAILFPKEYASVVVISDAEELTFEDSLRSMFSAAFPSLKGIAQASIDWASLSEYLCPMGNVLVRANGSYDERLADIDCIMLTEKIALFDVC